MTDGDRTQKNKPNSQNSQDIHDQKPSNAKSSTLPGIKSLVSGLQGELTFPDGGRAQNQTPPAWPRAQPSMVNIDLLPGLIQLMHVAMIVLAAFVGQEYGRGTPLFWEKIQTEATIVYVIWFVGIMTLLGQYQTSVILNPMRALRVHNLVALCAGMVIWSVYFARTPDDPLVLNWGIAAGICYFIFANLWAVIQFLLVALVTEKGWMVRNVVIVGAGAQTREMLLHFQMLRPRVNRVVGVFDDRHTKRVRDDQSYKILGAVDELLEFARNNPIDEVIIAMPWSAADRTEEMISRLKVLPVNIRLAPDMMGCRLHGRRPDDALIRGYYMIDVLDQPLAGWQMVAKNLEDRILALVALALLSPIMLMTALAIRLNSTGPILFRQKRYGFNNQVIHVYKFRSMYHVFDPQSDKKQATKGDPRITPVGRFIRRTSLDELPQLFNVLLGNMSLVGPRPHTVAHNHEYGAVIDGYFSRHKVKPGITGWAQVNGLRGETDTIEKMDYRVRYDAYYVQNWSILFDLEIMMLTVIFGIVGKNAY